MTLPDDDTVATHVEGVRAAHRTLLASIATLTDAAARGPSRLPDWSVGHALTHLARNADSNTWVLGGALVGEHRVQYPGGAERRSADIEAGSGRPAEELRRDVAESAARLEAVYDRMTPDAWDGHGFRVTGEPWPCRVLPRSRWREVEVHHADLGLGWSSADWSDGYVAAELPLALASLDDRLDDPAERRRLLTWLIGRGDVPTDLHLAPWGSKGRHDGS